MSTKNNNTQTTSRKAKSEKSEAKSDFNNLKKDVRVTSIDNWEWERLIYSEPKKADISDGSGHYTRVRIQYMYDDKTIGPAIIGLGKKYCFGVQPNNIDKDHKVIKDKNTKKPKPLTGYQVPIVMTNQNKDKPDMTKEEENEVAFFDMVREEISRYAVENKKALGLSKKTDAAIEGSVCNILWKKTDDEGNSLAETSPKLYTKLMYYPKKKEVGTIFYGPGDKPIDPLSQSNHFYIYPNIVFESLYIGGGKVALQHKIYDATIEPIYRLPQKRLARTNNLPASLEMTAPAENEQKAEKAEKESDVMMESEEESEGADSEEFVKTNAEEDDD